MEATKKQSQFKANFRER